MALGKAEIPGQGFWPAGRVSESGSQSLPGMPGTILAIIAVLAVPTTLWAGLSVSNYPIPTPASLPIGITTGPDGALWFTEYAVGKIGRITTAGVITEYTIPTASQPRSITTGPDGALWFTEYSGFKIGRITTAGVITEYPLPAGVYTQGIAAGPDGALWFTEISGQGENIGRITTTGALTQYPVGGAPDCITAGPDGALWFTESDVFTGNKIGRITTAGAITEYPTPTAGSEPEIITAGPDGALWFTELDGNRIGRITTAGVITEYPVPIGVRGADFPTTGPSGITAGRDGALWFTEPTGNYLGRITTAGIITDEYPVQASGNVTTGPDGALWLTAGSAIVRAVPGYTCTNTTPPSIASVDSASSYGGYSYFASGSWLEIKGANLADPADPRLTAATNPGQWTLGDFLNGVSAPTALDGISVSINGMPAYVWYLSPTQLNVQAPEDSATGNVAITVTNCNATSMPFQFPRRTLAPGLLAPASFAVGATQYMLATFASGGAYVLNTNTGASLGLNSRPAKPGDLIVAYGIGFGDVIPPSQVGFSGVPPPPSSILPGTIAEASNTLINSATISFGSTNAALSYSGLAAGFVGLYEFYITVPSGLANGDYQINVTQNGISVPQTMYLTVHN